MVQYGYMIPQMSPKNNEKDTLDYEDGGQKREEVENN